MKGDNMPQAFWRPALALASAVLVAACAGPMRPALYPNEHFQEVGPQTAQGDIDDCIQRAREAGPQPGSQIAGQTVRGGAVGAVAGTAAGAIAGNIGGGAAAGAAAGATGGLLHGLFKARELDPVQRGYVDECLRQKGYQPLGWR